MSTPPDDTPLSPSSANSADDDFEDAPAPTPLTPAGPVVAKAGSYFRNARYIMVTLLVGMGLYFGYDGYIGYPAANKKWEAANEVERASMKFHDALDINLQKVLFFTLPPVGIALLAYWLHKSRGTVRMENGIVSIPGHPPFSLNDVTKLDKRLWDRKGIAYVEYQTPAGLSGRATLDDFIYERKPIDQIYDAIVANLKERASEAPAE